MKASELKIGTVVAAVAGSSKYELRSSHAVKVEVIGLPQSGRVKVKFLEESHHGIGYQRYGVNPQEPCPVGATRTLSTKNLWMTWETMETRVENERRHDEDKARDKQLKEERLEAITKRIVTAIASSPELQWAGWDHMPGGVETHIKIPTEALEGLLDEAEG